MCFRGITTKRVVNAPKGARPWCICQCLWLAPPITSPLSPHIALIEGDERGDEQGIKQDDAQAQLVDGGVRPATSAEKYLAS